MRPGTTSFQYGAARTREERTPLLYQGFDRSDLDMVIGKDKRLVAYRPYPLGLGAHRAARSHSPDVCRHPRLVPDLLLGIGKYHDLNCPQRFRVTLVVPSDRNTDQAHAPRPLALRAARSCSARPAPIMPSEHPLSTTRSSSSATTTAMTRRTRCSAAPSPRRNRNRNPHNDEPRAISFPLKGWPTRH